MLKHLIDKLIKKQMLKKIKLISCTYNSMYAKVTFHAAAYKIFLKKGEKKEIYNKIWLKRLETYVFMKAICSAKLSVGTRLNVVVGGVFIERLKNELVATYVETCLHSVCYHMRWKCSTSINCLLTHGKKTER